VIKNIAVGELTSPRLYWPRVGLSAGCRSTRRNDWFKIWNRLI